MFSRELSLSGHTRRFSVTVERNVGWALRVEADGCIVRARQYTDWHRVERALSALEREVRSLEHAGWAARPAGGQSTKR